MQVSTTACSIDHWLLRHTNTHRVMRCVGWSRQTAFYLLSSGNLFHSVRKLALLVGREEKNSHPRPFPLLVITPVLLLFTSKALTYPHTFMHTRPSKGYYQPYRMNFLDIYLNLFLERFNLPGKESWATDGARRIEDREEEGEGSDRYDEQFHVYFTCQVMEFHSVVPRC